MGGDLRDAPARQGPNVPRLPRCAIPSVPILDLSRSLRLDGCAGRTPRRRCTMLCGAATANRTHMVSSPALAPPWTSSRQRGRTPSARPHSSRCGKYGIRREATRPSTTPALIEIPAPRWTAYHAKRFSVQPTLPGTRMTITERAHTSPIWYTPGP